MRIIFRPWHLRLALILLSAGAAAGCLMGGVSTYTFITHQHYHHPVMRWLYGYRMINAILFVFLTYLIGILVYQKHCLHNPKAQKTYPASQIFLTVSTIFPVKHSWRGCSPTHVGFFSAAIIAGIFCHYKWLHPTSGIRLWHAQYWLHFSQSISVVEKLGLIVCLMMLMLVCACRPGPWSKSELLIGARCLWWRYTPSPFHTAEYECVQWTHISSFGVDKNKAMIHVSTTYGGPIMKEYSVHPQSIAWTDWVISQLCSLSTVKERQNFLDSISRVSSSEKILHTQDKHAEKLS